MVNTIEIMPSLFLQSFIRGFSYREWDLPEISRPLFATHEFLITFNLMESKFGYIKPGADHSICPSEMKSELVITGISSQFNGFMTGKGKTRVFSIYFRPTGFHRIFGIPPVSFTNQIEEEAYSCRKSLDILHLQLRESKSIYEMITKCDDFLVNQLNKSKAKDPYNCMLSVVNCMMRNNESSSIERLAFDASMSLKTFERKFIEQVGTSPKMFSRIIRFNKALSLKMKNVRQTWTSVAHALGYFDQMHFIRDFKLFTGKTPTGFLKDTPPPTEVITRMGNAVI